jgi:hypothetical protein
MPLSLSARSTAFSNASIGLPVKEGAISRLELYKHQASLCKATRGIDNGVSCVQRGKRIGLDQIAMNSAPSLASNKKAAIAPRLPHNTPFHPSLRTVLCEWHPNPAVSSWTCHF